MDRISKLERAKKRLSPAEIRTLFADLAEPFVPGLNAVREGMAGNYGTAAVSGLLDVGGPIGKGIGVAAPALMGVVGKGARSLPLPEYGEITKFSKPLPSGELFREMSPSRFSDMFSGSMPFGPPITQFAEVPEMALGQGLNKGLMIKVNSEGLTGRPYFGKPLLEQSYLQKSGEFDIKEQPRKIVDAISEVWITPDAYKNLRKSEKSILDRQLKYLEGRGARINMVDKLPNELD
jgi:hypothetical protein